MNSSIVRMLGLAAILIGSVGSALGTAALAGELAEDLKKGLLG